MNHRLSPAVARQLFGDMCEGAYPDRTRLQQQLKALGYFALAIVGFSGGYGVMTLLMR
jgi:hypothetical protein